MVAFSPGFYAPGEPITGRPRVWVSHGTRDEVLPYAYTSGSLVPELRDAGYDVTFVSFDGDHGVPGEISESALSWFLEERTAAGTRGFTGRDLAVGTPLPAWSRSRGDDPHPA
jgi:predicted esterase